MSSFVNNKDFITLNRLEEKLTTKNQTLFLLIFHTYTVFRLVSDGS